MWIPSEKVRCSFCNSWEFDVTLPWRRDRVLLVFRFGRAWLNDFSGTTIWTEIREEKNGACVRACVRKRIKKKPGKGGSRNKMKKKTKAALKRKVGARIETQFDPRYEAPAEVGSPRAHLTWMRWQALSDIFSCTRALALSLIACINAFPACTRRLSGLPLSPCRLFPERNSFNVP